MIFVCRRWLKWAAAILAGLELHRGPFSLDIGDLLGDAMRAVVFVQALPSGGHARGLATAKAAPLPVALGQRLATALARRALDGGSALLCERGLAFRPSRTLCAKLPQRGGDNLCGRRVGAMPADSLKT
jgi:hypothetical protein